jgi:hypothetical protein
VVRPRIQDDIELQPAADNCVLSRHRKLTRPFSQSMCAA